MEVWAVMSDGKFFTVYVEDASGLYANVESHGLLGEQQMGGYIPLTLIF